MKSPAINNRATEESQTVNNSSSDIDIDWNAECARRRWIRDGVSDAAFAVPPTPEERKLYGR